MSDEPTSCNCKGLVDLRKYWAQMVMAQSWDPWSAIKDLLREEIDPTVDHWRARASLYQAQNNLFFLSQAWVSMLQKDSWYTKNEVMEIYRYEQDALRRLRQALKGVTIDDYFTKELKKAMENAVAERLAAIEKEKGLFYNCWDKLHGLYENPTLDQVNEFLASLELTCCGGDNCECKKDAFQIPSETQITSTPGYSFLLSPLVLDLNGDGVQTTGMMENWTMFDFDGDGFKNRTGWLSPEDGFLIFDRNNERPGQRRRRVIRQQHFEIRRLRPLRRRL